MEWGKAAEVCLFQSLTDLLGRGCVVYQDKTSSASQVKPLSHWSSAGPICRQSLWAVQGRAGRAGMCGRSWQGAREWGVPIRTRHRKQVGGGEETSWGRFFVIEKGGRIHIFPHLAPTLCKHGRLCIMLLCQKPAGSLIVYHVSTQSLWFKPWTKQKSQTHVGRSTVLRCHPSKTS